jgi:hypothetical protein
MQDWEWEVADASRFTEFLSLYQQGGLEEDELFSLMEVLVQCVEDMLENMPDQTIADRAWSCVEPLFLHRPELHISTAQYWACVGKTDPTNLFAISPRFRKLLQLMVR